MIRLTEDRVAKELQDNIDKLTLANRPINIGDKRYVKLALYESTGLEPEQILELIKQDKGN